MPVLDIDAGNTRVKWRLRKAGRLLSRGNIPTRDFHAGALVQAVPTVPVQVNLSCVANNTITQSVVSICKTWGSRLFIAKSSAFRAGVTCGYEQPDSLGVDRWLAILAAYNLAQGACVVVDAGSAITVDIVTAKGDHSGGYIVPGIVLLRDALLSGTARVRPGAGAGISVKPGQNTQDAVNHGLHGMIKGLVDIALSSMAAQEESITLFITGGDAEHLQELLGTDWRIETDLVLDGLSLASNEEVSGDV